MTPLRIIKLTTQIIAWLALIGTILPSLLYLLNLLDGPAMKTAMLVATLVWFAVTPWWMGREHGAIAPQGD